MGLWPTLSTAASTTGPKIRASGRGADFTGRLLTFDRSQTLTSSAVNTAALKCETTTQLSRGPAGNIEVVLMTAYVDYQALATIIVGISVQHQSS